jgi:hypothetical protein
MCWLSGWFGSCRFAMPISLHSAATRSDFRVWAHGVIAAMQSQSKICRPSHQFHLTRTSSSPSRSRSAFLHRRA